MISVEQQHTCHRGDQADSGHLGTTPTCLAVDLLAPELEVNGAGGGDHKGRQQDPPQLLV